MDAATFFAAADSCIPRWDNDCHDMPCCGPAVCHDRGTWSECEVEEEDDAAAEDAGCCSYDQQTCHVYDEPESLWCHEASSNCVACRGHWIVETARHDCTGRWQYCDAATTASCCGDTVCIDGACERPFCCVVEETGVCSDEDSCNYSATDCSDCGGSWQSRLDVGTTAEDTPPDSVVDPIKIPPQQQPPPTQKNPPPIPTGEFVPAGYSERIVIPEPSAPVLREGSRRTSCPHDADGLKDWHDATTWPSGSVPSTTGQDIVLPNNARVVLRRSPVVRFGLITIPPSSALIIAESASGIDLDVGGIDVQGELILGSETCRIETPTIITLHGARPDDVSTAPVETYKGIAVSGTIQLHGKRYFRTWTRLAKSIISGDTELFLQHAVNWEAGQEVVLVTTAMKDSREWHQNEVHTIAAVDTTREGVGSVVALESAIEYTHIGSTNYQAEVGLLSRSIVIQGSEEDSEPTDPDPLNCVGEFDRFGDQTSPCPFTEITGFGGHVIVHKGGKGYIEGVEFFRMGMTNMVGRYPVHFHLLDTACTDCYVEASSFHHSFYRCVAIHGTNGVRVSENVAYDITGYCYYLEDGVEQDNTISYNLAAFIHSIGPDQPAGYGQNTDVYQESDRLALPADVTASGFYITNLQNNIIGNTASGVSTATAL